MSRISTRIRSLFILLGIMLFLIVVWRFKQELTNDRDTYLTLAENISHSRGLVDPGSGKPTAYRPPLYPLLLGMGENTGLPPPLVVAIINGISFVLIVYLAGRITVVKQLPPVGKNDADEFDKNRESTLFKVLFLGMVACDPLLLYYSAQPMTELVSACWSIWIFSLIYGIYFQDHSWKYKTSANESNSAHCIEEQKKHVNYPLLSAMFLSGISCGLAALTRPTFLIVAASLFVWMFTRYLAGWDKHLQVMNRKYYLSMLVFLLAVLLPVGIWGARNYKELGGVVVTTTHGGYTLLLANNESFYEVVVDVHPLAVWDLPADDPRSQQFWWEQEIQRMKKAGLDDEISRDHYLSEEGRKFIQENPLRFIKACCYRVFWFWNPMPLANNKELPRIVLYAVILFYVIENLACLTGMIVVIIRREYFTAWGLCMCMILAYEALHLFYWTNARMRAPVVPLIAFMAARTLAACLKKQQLQP